MSTFPANNELPQSASVVSRWLLDEASGDRADSVSTNDLTDRNTVGAGTGYSNATSGVSFDNAADFEADNSELLTHDDNAELSPGGDFGVFAWVKIESDPGEYTIAAKRDGNLQNTFVFAYRDSGGTKQLLLEYDDDGSGSADALTVATTLTSGTWYHVGFTLDVSASEVKFYVDGSQVGTTQTGTRTSLFDGTAKWGVGAMYFFNDTTGNHMDGLMNDVIYWDGVVLTSAEVSDLYDLYTTASTTTSTTTTTTTTTTSSSTSSTTSTTTSTTTTTTSSSTSSSSTTSTTTTTTSSSTSSTTTSSTSTTTTTTSSSTSSTTSTTTSTTTTTTSSSTSSTTTTTTTSSSTSSSSSSSTSTSSSTSSTTSTTTTTTTSTSLPTADRPILETERLVVDAESENNEIYVSL